MKLRRTKTVTKQPVQGQYDQEMTTKTMLWRNGNRKSRSKKDTRNDDKKRWRILVENGQETVRGNEKRKWQRKAKNDTALNECSQGLAWRGCDEQWQRELTSRNGDEKWGQDWRRKKTTRQGEEKWWRKIEMRNRRENLQGNLVRRSGDAKWR